MNLLPVLLSPSTLFMALCISCLSCGLWCLTRCNASSFPFFADPVREHFPMPRGQLPLSLLFPFFMSYVLFGIPFACYALCRPCSCAIRCPLAGPYPMCRCQADTFCHLFLSQNTRIAIEIISGCTRNVALVWKFNAPRSLHHDEAQSSYMMIYSLPVIF